MEEQVVSNIINVVKTSTDRGVIYKALVKLRTDLVKDREGIATFRKCGGIPATIPLLHRTHEKILEVALSILANCCTELESCMQAAECKILPPVISIMKNIASSVIQCRACRLLGNLLRENKIDISQQCTAIAQALCLILEESFEAPTTMMAARAVRLTMLQCENFLKEFVKCDGVKIIMKILIKHLKNNDVKSTEKLVDTKPDPVGLKSCQHREKYFQEVVRNLEGVRSDIFDRETLKREKKQNNNFLMPNDKAVLDILGETLKSLQILSDVQARVPVFEFVANGLGFSCLVFLADENNDFRAQALKILSNFSKNPSAANAVSEADAVTAACYLITSDELAKPLSESESRHCFNIICLLSGNSCNRAKIRRSGALGKLIEKAKSSIIHPEVSSILYALNNFQYDNLSMQLLLRQGLVGILIKELDAYLNSDDEYMKAKCQEKQRLSKKRKCESSPKKCNKNPKMWLELNEPESPTSALSLNPLFLQSPCSSRSLSPISISSKTCGDDFDSETYSPVCSDNEDDEDDNQSEDESKIEENPVMKLLAVCCKSDNNIDETISDKEDDDDINHDKASVKVPLERVQSSTIDIIENLLLRTSLVLKFRSDLSKPETLNTILQAINVFGYNASGFISALCNIMSESEFFVPIVKQDVIYPIYKMTKNEELKPAGEGLLDTLAGVGESGYGRGELTRMLSKGELKLQKQAAIAIAFIIRARKLLYPLLTESGALYILINTILNKDDEYRCEAAAGLTFLSQALGVSLPIYDLNQFNCEKEFDEQTDFPVCGEDNADTMKFILHLGCSEVPVKFDKKLLTKNSEVFDSMLNSDFRESNEKEVHLKNVSVNGIKYFLNLINLESKGKSPNIPPVYHFDSILEAYELSRMYILENLEKKLLILIIHRLSELTALKVFEWAFKNFHPQLSEISVNYFLCSDIDATKKVELFRKADYSAFSKEWNQMVIDTILDKCGRIYENMYEHF